MAKWENAGTPLHLLWADTRVRSCLRSGCLGAGLHDILRCRQYVYILSHASQPVTAVLTCKCGETLGRPTCNLEYILVQLLLGALGDLSFELHQDLGFLFPSSDRDESLMELLVGDALVLDRFPNLL